MASICVDRGDQVDDQWQYEPNKSAYWSSPATLRLGCVDSAQEDIDGHCTFSGGDTVNCGLLEGFFVTV